MSHVFHFNAVTWLTGFSFFSFILIIPLFAAELGLSLTSIGIVLGAFSVAIILFSPLWGHLSDRLLRRKPFLILGNLLLFVTSLLHFYVTGFEQLLVLRFLQGVAFATSPMLTALFSEHFGHEAEDRFGGFSAANALGWGFGSVLAGLLAETVGIRAVFVIVAFGFLVNALLTHFFIPEKAAMRSPEESNSVPGKLFYLYATIFTRHSAAIALWSVFPLYLKGFVGSLALVGAVNASNMFVQPLFMIGAGKLAERMGMLQLMWFGILGSIVTFIVYATAPNVFQILVGQIMIAASWGALWIGMNLYIMQEVPAGGRGKAFGYLTSAMTTAAAIGPFLGGLLSDNYGMRAMILIVGGLMALSLPFLVRLQIIDKRCVK